MNLEAPSSDIAELILQRVGDVEDTDPVDLPPLYDAIDPDALEEIFAETQSGELRVGEISFPYAGHEVTIHFDGSSPIVTIE